VSLFLDIFGYLSVVLRGLILVTQSFTLGGLAFHLLLLTPLEGRPSDASVVRRRCRAFLCVSALSWALLTIFATTISAAALVGTLQVPWTEALTADFALADVMIAVSAGAIALLVPTTWSKPRSVALLVLGLLALVMQLNLTHAASRIDVRRSLILADAIHMLGAGVWIGGLPYFLMALSGCKEPEDWRLIGRRYSLMSMASVTAIVAGGVAMAFEYIGSLEAIYGTAYGVMTSAKVALFSMTLALGASNYFVVERLRRDPRAPVSRLKRFAEVELGIGMTALLAAASLTSLPPAIDLAQNRLTWQEIVERATPQWPVRLTSPTHDQLTISLLQAKIASADKDRASAPTAYVPGEGTFLPRNAEDIAWSEYNHHWAGIFVVLIGMLALIEHLRWGQWARHWPLIFLVMAAFLFLRSDEQAWPLGPLGFFESFRDPEVAQHRLFTLLIVVFGVFEWRVRIRPKEAGKGALVFPLTTALGGALLLTHSHTIANIKDQLLIEMSHTPLAICGVATGWARWVELRLDGRLSRIASWIWPMAFMLVGFILLVYREA
jgi:putative copper resistance protein D